MILIASIILHQIDAFDALTEKIITYTYSGNQSVKNRLVIHDSQTNTIVYDNSIVTLKLSHTIPPSSLENGKLYNCYIIAYDIDNNQTISTKKSFLCLSKPTFSFINISHGQIVLNSSLLIELDYAQEQGELLNEYKIEIYSSAMNVFFDSGIKYGSPVPIAINGLADNSLYHIKAFAKTVNGFPLETDLISFSVEYKVFSLYSVLVLENVESSASVKISSNIVSIFGRSIPEDIAYINLDNEMVDLRNGEMVVFAEGINIEGNFLIELLGFGFKSNQIILSLSDYWVKFDVYWRTGNFADSYGNIKTFSFVELRNSDTLEYVIFSNKIEKPLNTDRIYIRILRVNGAYKAYVKYLT